MKILLLGYGKMGKEIEKVALSRGHEIVGKIDINNQHELEQLDTDAVDVAIEFSTPEAAATNIKKCLQRGWPVVSGTTGWLEHKLEIEALCLQNGGAFFYASNYSIGVNLFFRLNTILAKLVKGQGYDIKLTETHHIHKKDAPSGTAITLAEGIQKGNEEVLGWTLLPDKKPNHVPIESIREGEIPGTHTITYSSPIDSIEITHTAHGRQGFAQGAVIAGEWIQGKKGTFGMDDLLNFEI